METTRLWGPRRHSLVRGFGRFLHPTLTSEGRPNRSQVEKDRDEGEPNVASMGYLKSNPASGNVQISSEL
jgi:hypothetical protein